MLKDVAGCLEVGNGGGVGFLDEIAESALLRDASLPDGSVEVVGNGLRLVQGGESCRQSLRCVTDGLYEPGLDLQGGIGSRQSVLRLDLGCVGAPGEQIGDGEGEATGKNEGGHFLYLQQVREGFFQGDDGLGEVGVEPGFGVFLPLAGGQPGGGVGFTEVGACLRQRGAQQMGIGQQVGGGGFVEGGLPPAQWGRLGMDAGGGVGDGGDGPGATGAAIGEAGGVGGEGVEQRIGEGGEFDGVAGEFGVGENAGI